MKPPQKSARRIPANFLRRADYTTFTPNERRLLNMVRHKGPISRADMARNSDLTMQSVSRLIDGLIERGLVRGGEKRISGPGQPSLLIGLVPDAAFAIGVSIMTDAVSAVLMDLSGKIRSQRMAVIDVASRKAVVEKIGETVEDMVREAGVDRARVFGIGVAATGYFVAGVGINTPASMDEWALIDLEEALGESLGLPVWVENDGNAAAAGESLFGVGQWQASFAYLHIATGLGGGVVVDGKLMRGFRGNAGEFTGLLAPDDRANRPTLALLLELVRERGVPVNSVTDLVVGFDPSWPGVETWLERTRGAASAIISAIAATLDPEAIIIGGRAPPVLARMLAERLSYYGVPHRGHERPFPNLLPAEAEGDAAAMGAAAIPLKEHFFG